MDAARELAQYLPEVDAAGDHPRAAGFAVLLAACPGPRRRTLADEMLASAQAIGDHAEAALALASIAACSNDNARETELLAVNEARRIVDAEARAFGLLDLIQYLGPVQREVAGEAALLTTQIPSANRPFILRRAVGYLETSAMEALLTAPPHDDDSPWDRDDWSRSLVEILSPVLPDSLVPAALRGVHDIDDTPSRAKALGALAPRLPAPQRTESLRMPSTTSRDCR